MFTDHIRVGSLEANSAGVKKRTVAGYLCNVARIFSGVGDKDPRMDVPVKIGLRLFRKICAYA